ncbi:MAG: hypothetical protein NTY38_09670, partial [Acidobacteria bacterium]|nr:hypothetical protein [Acidobacteriota bacterium]
MRTAILLAGAWAALAWAGEPVRIDNETQLFLDEFGLERTTALRRVLHQPAKHGPILDEHGGDFGVGGVYLGNIVTRDNAGRFHMLYRYAWDDPSVASLSPNIGVDKAHWFRESVGYATSTDGIHWKKPVLGLVDAPSSFRKEGPYSVAASISRQNNFGAPIDFIYDLNEHGNVSDPAKRFLLRVTKKDDTHNFAKVIESQLYYARDWPDFAGDPKWKEKLTPIPGGKLSPRGFLTLAGYDAAQSVWFQVCQGRVADWTKREGRDIVRYESPDLQHWTGPDVVLPIQPDESKDPADYLEYMDLLAYHVGGARTGAWLGQMVAFHSDRTNQQYRMPRPFVVWRKGTTELRLVLSRDAGRTWQRVGGKQTWLPHHTEDRGYDRLAFAHYPIRVGDELWLYYSGWNGDHLVYKFDGSLFYDDGYIRRPRTARATLRWDGYLSLDAAGETGEAVTRPVVFRGSRLTVNAAAKAGELRVELRDADDKPLPGFAAADSVPFQGDGVSAPVRWRGNRTVAKLAGRTVRVAFRLKNASLYGYRFE